MGDEVLIYFGYPQAHEDDAERAVRAGLEARGLLPRPAGALIFVNSNYRSQCDPPLG
jgi:class 3 adenylate cyclase